MAKLKPEALYANEPTEEHYIRSCEINGIHESHDWNDYEKDWKPKVALVGVGQDRSLAMLRQMDLLRDKTPGIVIHPVKETPEEFSNFSDQLLDEIRKSNIKEISDILDEK